MEGEKIEIRDTGCGMTAEQIHRLGMPYYSTKEKGTGLGMMVVFNIIKSMHDEMEIKSEQGKGTLFSIAFPLVKPYLNETNAKVLISSEWLN